MDKKSILFTISITLAALVIFPPLVLAGPASTNYQLKEYGFGSGGTGASGMSSTNYKTFGTAGEVESGQQSSTNYKTNSGLTYTLQSNVPPAPTLDNGSGTYYNKISCTLNTGSNPNTTEFAIAVSPDSFATTKYVQADYTLGTFPVWQTNAVWGASGFTIIGLTSGTTYSVKVAAQMGNFTQTGFGPTTTQATVSPYITFSRTPATIDFQTIPLNTVTDSPSNITINFATNAASGGNVYIYSANGGLLSSHTAHKILSMTADLAGQGEGSGAQVVSATQTTGGPLTSLSPYNGSNSTVGIVDSTVRTIFSSSGPITGGAGVLKLKAKISNTTPAANDYADVLTLIASAIF